MASETKLLSAHVEIDLAKKVDEVARRMNRSRGWAINRALAAWVEQEEWRHRSTVDALRDVDCGNVVDHDAIVTWAENLKTSDR